MDLLQGNRGPFSQLHSRVATDVGNQRPHNEDAFACEQDLGLYLVCDGMGGHAAGEVAASLAVYVVTNYLREAAQTFGDTVPAPSLLRELIELAIFRASEVVYQKGQEDPAARGMGTTLTLLWFVNHRLYIGHVGDSRAYLLRQNEALLLTEDHTLVNELYKLGRLTESQTQDFPFKNALSRSIGLYPSVQVDTLELDLLPGDQFVLCSDGLHGYLDEDGLPLTYFFEYGAALPDDQAQRMVDYAKEHGGKDNITVIVLEVPAMQQETLEMMRSRLTMKTLQELRLFQGLSYKEYVMLFNLCRPVHCQHHQKVIEQGQVGEALYVIIEGQVKVLRDGISLASLQAGAHFGELSLIDQLPRFADVVSDGESHLIFLTKVDFEVLLMEEPLMGIKLMRNILRTLSQIVREQSMKLLEGEVTPSAMRDTLVCDSFAMLNKWSGSSDS